MDKLLNEVKDFCLSEGIDKTYWIALSGGLDSVVLLNLFAALRPLFPLNLNAVYIHHGLSPNADHWAMHCDTICSKLNIHFHIHKVHVDLTLDQSPEEIAREQRYRVFATLLKQNDVLLTAHHQDDQAETVLLQLLRGAGPKGLSAMPKIKSLGLGLHARPLLHFSRDDLKKYAEQHALSWIDDESNTNTDFSRNFLRHEILPLLKQRWPSIATTLSRTATHCSATQQIVDDILLDELNHCGGNVKGTLSVKKLLAFSPNKQKLLLRAWLSEHEFILPSAQKLQQIQLDMLQARSDKMPHITWGDVELRRFRDDLHVMQRLSEFDPTQRYTWNMDQPLFIKGLGLLECPTSHLLAKQVEVRFRQGGETIKLRGCHHSLKNLFQEWNIPTWQRDRIPLIYWEDKLCIILGYAITDELSIIST
jgi:tRNA(Ile)-lysidine synthase